MPLIIVVAGIALLLLLTIKIKLNTFVSLIIVSIAVAIASGMDLSKVVTSVESGLGGTLGHIGLIFGFGVMLGRLLADAGGAQRIALTMLNYFGKNKLDWAVVCSAFIVGIALFFEVGLILLVPILFAIAREAKYHRCLCVCRCFLVCWSHTVFCRRTPARLLSPGNMALM